MPLIASYIYLFPQRIEFQTFYKHLKVHLQPFNRLVFNLYNMHDFGIREQFFN